MVSELFNSPQNESIRKLLTFHDQLATRLKGEYPSLYEKAIKHHIGNLPNFNALEIAERTRLIKRIATTFRFSSEVFFIRSTIGRGPEPIQLPEGFDLNNLPGGLYLLARCGDEGAFLELVAIDHTFCHNWFFQESLKYWRERAFHHQCKRSQKILKDFSKAVQLPHRKKVGRPQTNVRRQLLAFSF